MEIIKAKTSGRKYPVFTGNGIIRKASEIINTVFKPAEKIMLVTDDNVYRLHSKAIEDMLSNTNKPSKTVIIEQGETSKNLENTKKIYDNMLDFNMHRNDLVIAFGGGVIGDLAGFAASTFHRGVPLLQFPTTIVAQVDSSIGGKVVVNYKGVKNVIGSFYQPHAIITDYGLLLTLKENDIRNGLSEIIKYGVVFDKKILSALDFSIIHNGGNTCLQEIIKKQVFQNIIGKCINIKLAVVGKDEMDTGYRNLLNFGHTAGHALEKLSMFSEISHGIAVAWGMLVAIDISIELGFTNNRLKDFLISLYKKFDIPVNLKIKNISGTCTAVQTANEIINAMKFDKKFTSEKNKFILLKGLNRPVVKTGIDEKIIAAAISKNMSGEKNEKGTID